MINEEMMGLVGEALQIQYRSRSILGRLGLHTLVGQPSTPFDPLPVQVQRATSY